MNKKVPKYQVVWNSLTWQPTPIPHQGIFVATKYERIFNTKTEALKFVILRPSAKIRLIKVVDEAPKVA